MKHISELTRIAPDNINSGDDDIILNHAIYESVYDQKTDSYREEMVGHETVVVTASALGTVSQTPYVSYSAPGYQLWCPEDLLPNNGQAEPHDPVIINPRDDDTTQ